MGHLRAEPGLLARGRPLTPKTRPRRRAEYSDDAVAWPARARHDRLPALNLRRRSRFGPGQLPIKRSLAHARSRVAVWLDKGSPPSLSGWVRRGPWQTRTSRVSTQHWGGGAKGIPSPGACSGSRSNESFPRPMTNSPRTAWTTLRWLARALALAAAYFVVAKIGLRYATIGPSISPVWPPTGLAVAALVLLGPEYWPAILLGAFLAYATTSIPVLAAAGIACGNAAEAMVAAYLLRSRAGQHLALDDLLGVRTLVGVAAPVGALASATVGVTTLWLAHVVSGAGVWSALSLWWAGDYLGALVVAPVFLTWLTWAGPAGVRIGRRTALELSLLVGGAVVATMAIFGGLLPASLLPQAEYPYLLFPFVIVAALRFGPRGASLLTLTVATLAVGYTVRGGGPFVMQTVPSTDTALLLYIGILAITGLSLGPATARHERAERALREANEHLAAVIQSSPLAIYTLDPASTVRSWNRAAEALYGWPAEEVIGRPLPTIGQDLEDHGRLRDRVLRGESLRGVEVTRRRKDGTSVNISLSVAPLHDAAGRVTGMLSLAADVTEMRQLEVQYRQAQKMEAVGRLAGGIAHDFNNLLTAIIGTTALVLEDLGLESRARLDIQEIEKAAKRAAGLTRQLLIFSRQQVLEPRALDLNALVANLEKMLHRLIGEDIELRTKAAALLGAVRADPGQLEQAIVNLVVNARDAMPKGGRLTIETADVELDRRYVAAHVPTQPGPYVLLAISDTGVGMDGATKARLFEPFSRPKSLCAVRDSGSRRSTVSSSRAAGTSGRTASWARAPPSRSISREWPRLRRLRSRRRAQPRR